MIVKRETISDRYMKHYERKHSEGDLA